ncbi:MAG: SpoIIE family protein phosphatase [Spirochaeta sp.]|jgi:sigma-B regulation protein RsbU (phosphoserine phosphatase)|nr:SpoIIE family protein phosphatase [Spirochaeta sp.]
MTEPDNLGDDSSRYLIVVDDEPAILSVVTTEIRDWAKEHQVQILAARSGDKALTLIEKHGDDVWIVLSDLRMPGMSGNELLQHVTSRFPLTVCLALTGEDNVQELSRTIRSGIFGFIPKPWEPDELINDLTRALEYARLQRERLHYMHSLEFELQWAGELQQKLLEAEFPLRADIDVDVVYRPLPWLSCGGDYYDVIPYRDDSIIVLVGDVAGHGVKAAFVTAMLKSMIYRGYIRRSMETGFSPADFLAWLNTQFLEALAAVPDVILTFSATLIDIPGKQLVTSGAGHEPLFLHRDSGHQVFGATGPVIGVAEGVSYHDETITLESGDLLTFLTDGASEYPQAGRRLSAESVAETLARHTRIGAAPDELFAELWEKLDMPEQQDDVTMIRVRLT